MSLVVFAEAQDRVGDSITQDMIDEEERWLVGEIGPLIGPRTETFFLNERGNWQSVDGLWLSRYTDSVSLSGGLVEGTDFRLIGNHLIERISDGASWSGDLTATYTPTDESVVTGVIYDLLTYRTVPLNVQSVRVGIVSETYFPSSADPVRSNQLAKIIPAARLGMYGSPFRYSRHRLPRTLVEAVGS